MSSLLAQWLAEDLEKDHAKGIVHGMRSTDSMPPCMYCWLNHYEEAMRGGSDPLTIEQGEGK